MTSPYLISDLKRDEGCRLHAYPDPLSGGDPWTIGYGCTGPGISKGVVWTQAQADDELAKRVGALIPQLREALAWFTDVPDLRQDVLCNMAYQMGVAGLLTFKGTLNMVMHGDYASAADHMLDSAWARQTPSRAKRLALQMRSGEHQP